MGYCSICKWLRPTWPLENVEEVQHSQQTAETIECASLKFRWLDNIWCIYNNVNVIIFMPSVSTNDLKLCIIHEDITSHTRIIGLSVASPELRLLGGVLNRTL
jgi:hypothetical protein